MIHRWIPLILLLVLSSMAWAVQKPLLMPGKQALYQRVVAVPGARLADRPGDEELAQPVTPFSVFYVYERRHHQGREWLRVGIDRHGSLSGWLAAEETLPWNQGLTVAFRDPVGHDRVLLFRDRQALEGLIETPDSPAYRRLYEQAVSGRLPPDSPVIAIQPPGYIDIRKQFYLVPILDYRETWLGAEKARLLKIASVPLNPIPEPAEAPKPAATEKAQSTAPAPRRAGIVFVIDATLSMDDYIDRTREAVTKIYDQLAEQGQLGRVSFGLVAYRDNIDAVPGLGYVARTYVTLDEGNNPGYFLEKMAQLKAATVSSKDFREDAYAGLREAIEAMDWGDYDARYVVLITDAGAREGSDPLSTTGLSTDALRRMALDNHIALFVLHLLTPSVKADHRQAEAQYRRLTDYPGIGSLYYAVPTGDLEEFGLVVDALSQQLSRQVAQATAPAPAPKSTAEAPAEPAPKAPAKARLAELQEKVSRLGYALRMHYLQPAEGGKIPRVFDAWILDRDPRDPEWRTVEIRVLLTRDQLSDLQSILKEVLARAEEGLLSPQNFLDELKSLAATVSRNPEELGATTATTAGQGASLADMGLIGDYIEGLPYKGEVMNLSLEDWQNWPARRQIEFLRRLEEKIAYYQALHDNTDLWISLDGGPVDCDAVYPLALEMLP